MTATAMAAAPALSCPGAAAMDHLSWSCIRTYATCPRKFAFRYIERVPEEFMPASLTFGSAFHAALDVVHQSRIEGAEVPATDELLKRYDESWRENSASLPIAFTKQEDVVVLRETAARMIQAYLDYLYSSGVGSTSTIIGIEERRRFRLLAEVPAIEMRLDLLELMPNGDLIVSDLKTSRSRWNETKARENLPQLILYSTGLMPLLRELGAKRIVPRFIVVTKAKSPVVQVVEPTATQCDVDRLRAQVCETWVAVNTGVFPRRESWACAQCPYKRRCLG